MTACPCGSIALLVTGANIYPHRPDLAGKSFWRCPDCGAYVGCHPGSKTPLGSPADAVTRAARSAAHASFDPLWREKKNQSRRDTYKWLAKALNINPDDCHIGMMDVATARRVVEVCRERKRA